MVRPQTLRPYVSHEVELYYRIGTPHPEDTDDMLRQLEKLLENKQMFFGAEAYSLCSGGEKYVLGEKVATSNDLWKWHGSVMSRSTNFKWLTLSLTR